MKTRAKKPTSKSTKTNKDADIVDTVSKPKILEPSVATPPHVFILPKNLSTSARIITLPNPCTSTPSRYLIDPQRQSCFEFTKVAAPKRACKSWLLAPERCKDSEEAIEESENDPRKDEGYVLEKPDLMVATPIDPAFIMLPALCQQANEKQMYLSASDYLDRLEEKSDHFKELMTDTIALQNVQQMFEARMRQVCDVMDIGDGEFLYRLSVSKLLALLCQKAKRVVDKGEFPASMEERFVKQALAVPLLSIRREESGISIAEDSQTTEGTQSEMSASEEVSQQDSQSSTAAASTAATSVASQASPAQVEDSKKDAELQHLLRLRTALSYILKSYVPTALQDQLQNLLSDPTASPIDFSTLHEHLSHLEKLRKEAQTLRSLSDNISRKRSAVDEDDAEAMEKAEAKKRKKEEEEIRKKNVSRGVKALEKVDRSGMKTLSSFFSAKPAAKKG